MTLIHQTAIIEDGASLGADVRIGPYCFIGSKVVL
ncbi:MAG: acyl-[acyl-carrier-protein]--UDP-N-acetylglucosamine O-acyltransferase, partial [Hyphomicrobiales bacterium]|nr:acyl-[acyl-carrier-protein]--UDP-N-acetylglucosamine O-acyltransferase [Hyphomicrobiales bacterium]MBV9115025.1 acyl-[acyl-carrier-protein]--UDP-N-acetylglucosamine O-acyltransferase [Hyphomicrobiales bacterium]